MNNTLLTREQLGVSVFQEVEHLLEAGYSQVLGREQALQVAAWALKIAGESDLQHQVLAELVELPDNLGWSVKTVIPGAMPGSVIAQYVGMGSYTTQLNPMVDINDTMVVLKNGEVVGMHPNKVAADNQVQELILEWQRYSDNGSDVRAPRFAVLTFNGWMRLSNEFVFWQKLSRWAVVLQTLEGQVQLLASAIATHWGWLQLNHE